VSRDKAQLVLNLAVYQVGWFACVLGAAHGWATAGTAAGIGLWVLHLGLSRDRATEAKVAAACLGVGLVADSLQGATGRLVFAGSPWPGLAPPWVLTLWLLIAATLRGALSWLSGRYGLAAVLGAVAGPLAYVAGERLGAATFGAPRWLSVLSLAVEWGLATPLIVFLARRLGDERPTGYRWP
jgi:hypothetical protein